MKTTPPSIQERKVSKYLRQPEPVPMANGNVFVPARRILPSGSTSKPGSPSKPWMVDLLRIPHVTLEDADKLYEIIKDQILRELLGDNEVNLFDVVTIFPFGERGRSVWNGKIQDLYTYDSFYGVRCTMNKAFKVSWRENADRFDRKE